MSYLSEVLDVFEAGARPLPVTQRFPLSAGDAITWFNLSCDRVARLP
jgi:hypothetical protein